MRRPPLPPLEQADAATIVAERLTAAGGIYRLEGFVSSEAVSTSYAPGRDIPTDDADNRAAEMTVALHAPGRFDAGASAVTLTLRQRGGPGMSDLCREHAQELELFAADLPRFIATLRAALARAYRAGVILPPDAGDATTLGGM